MDAIGAITSITAGVMRRIADSIEGAPAPQPQSVVHYHFHLADPSQADNLDKMDRKVRGLFKR
ncbi:hypothetical protein GS921_00330 [Rhodococcus hoagii]|nr:hypothetical protein [Prescottella equi]NKV28225.1 hypothetical protein [Prescottella equi]